MLPILVGAALAVGTVSSVAGAYYGHKAAKSEAERLKMEYEARRKSALYNAQVADFNRGLVLSRRKKLTEYENTALFQNKMKGDQVVQAQRVAAAGAGVNLSSESMTEIRKTTMWQNSLEADAIRKSYNAGRWDFEMQALSYQKEAHMNRMSAGTLGAANPRASAAPYIWQGIGAVAGGGLQAGLMYG